MSAPAVPASGDVGTAHVAVTEVATGGGTLFVQLQLTGAPAADVVGQPGGLQARVFDATGREVAPSLWAVSELSGPQGGAGPTTLRLYLQAAGKGVHRLVVTFQGQRFESRFTIS